MAKHGGQTVLLHPLSDKFLPAVEKQVVGSYFVFLIDLGEDMLRRSGEGGKRGFGFA